MNDLVKRDFSCTPNTWTEPVLELASTRPSKGRTPIKLILHRISKDQSDHNKNGLVWIEEHVRKNLDSIKGMPICAEFLSDDDGIPHSHGQTGVDGKNPLFEDSVVVGSCEKGYIAEVNIDGENQKVCMADGYLYNQRYPKFVKWVTDRIKAKKRTSGSIEICGLPEFDEQIVYDGGYKKLGRIPKHYEYTGYAVLTVTPADDKALVVEINTELKKYKKEKENKQMEFEKIMLEINSLKESTKAITESLACEDKITELNQELDTLKETNAELEKDVAEKDKTLEEAEKKLTEAVEKRDELQKEVDKLYEAAQIAKMKEAISDFTEEEQAYAAEDIKQFESDPYSTSVDVIVGKIYAMIGKIAKETEKKEDEQVSTEVNSADIYGYINMPKGDSEDNVEIY